MKSMKNLREEIQCRYQEIKVLIYHKITRNKIQKELSKINNKKIKLKDHLKKIIKLKV